MSRLVAFVNELKAAGFSREDAMREWERELEEKRQERELEEKRQERELEEKRQERIMQLSINTSLPNDQRVQLVAALAHPGE
jgi:ABC-type uncharacterized transport system ATPase subunit